MAQRKILIPVDDSVASTRAFELYLEDLQAEGDRVYIVRVPKKIKWINTYGDLVSVPSAVDPAQVGQEIECFEDRMKNHIAELQSLHVNVQIQWLETCFKAEEQIVKVANDVKPNWIIMDTTASFRDYVSQNVPTICNIRDA